MRRTQLSSAHYFQRPDRKATTRRPVRHQLRSRRARRCSGYGFYARLAKESGNWLWETSQNWRSPGFEVNDIAVLEPHRLQVDAGERAAAVDEARQLVPQRRARSSAGSSSSTTTATAPTCRSRSSARSRFPNYMRRQRLRHQPSADVSTQLPHARRRRWCRAPATTSTRANVNGDSRKRVRWDFGGDHGRRHHGRRLERRRLRRPHRQAAVNLRISFGPSYSRHDRAEAVRDHCRRSDRHRVRRRCATCSRGSTSTRCR